jgi:tripartite ATP-independent transporter DctP family solute receptor
MINRRSVLKYTAAATLGGFSLRHASAANEFRWKWGNSQPNNHPNNIRSRDAVAKIKQETNGRVDITIFPDGQLGGDSDMNAQMRSGAIDIYTSSGGLLGAMVPVAGIMNMPFAFTDYSQVWTAMDGPLGKHINAQIAKIGIHVHSSYFDNGFRAVTSSSVPIRSSADLRGFKIRVPNSRIGFALFKSLGAAPVSMNIADVYSSLQTKVVDGQENSLLTIETSKFNEVQKYCSMTNHSWEALIAVTSMKRWNEMPRDLQEIVTRNLRDAALRQREDGIKLNQSLRSALEAKGLVFNDPDPQEIRAALSKSGFYKEWRGTYGEEAWSLLTKYSPALA